MKLITMLGKRDPILTSSRLACGLPVVQALLWVLPVPGESRYSRPNNPF